MLKRQAFYYQSKSAANLRNTLLDKGYMCTTSNSDKRRCDLWKEEATIGLKNAAEQEG
jgi:hypothetical protein